MPYFFVILVNVPQIRGLWEIPQDLLIEPNFKVLLVKNQRSKRD